MTNSEPKLIRVSQGDSAKDVSATVCKRIRVHRYAVLQNAGEFSQKLVSVVEQTKRTLAQDNVKVYQYNKLEIAQEVFAEQDEFRLDRKKIQYRVPKLTVHLSLDPQSLGEDWTSQ